MTFAPSPSVQQNLYTTLKWQYKVITFVCTCPPNEYKDVRTGSSDTSSAAAAMADSSHMTVDSSPLAAVGQRKTQKLKIESYFPKASG